MITLSIQKISHTGGQSPCINSKSDFRAVKVLACEAVPKSKKLLKFTLNDGTGTDRTILSGIHAFYEPEELIGKTLICALGIKS